MELTSASADARVLASKQGAILAPKNITIATISPLCLRFEAQKRGDVSLPERQCVGLTGCECPDYIKRPNAPQI